MNFLAYIAVVIFLIVAYFLGVAIRMLFTNKDEDPYFSTFKNLFVGMLLIVFGVAVVQTRGITILWGFLLVTIFYLLLERPKIHIPTVSIKNLYPLLVMLVITLACYMLQGMFFYDTPYSKIAQGDFYSYAEVIDYMWNTHVETSTFWSILTQDPTLNVAGPFHYPELWLASIFYGLFGFGVIESQVIISHVIMVTILAMGMIALVRSITKDIWMFAFGIVSVFLGGVVLVNILPQAIDFVFFCGCSPKFAMLSILYVWSTILMLKHDDRFFYPLLLLPIASISLAPVIGIVLFCMGIFYFIRKDKSYGLKLVGSIVLVELLIVLFYILQSNQAGVTGVPTLDILIKGHALDKLKCLKILVGTIVILVFNYGIYFLPTIVLLFTQKRKLLLEFLKEYSQFIVYVVLSLVSGLCFWVLLHPMHDSTQFFTTATLVLNNIFIIVLLVKQYTWLEKRWEKMVMGVYFCAIVILNVIFVPQHPFYHYYKMPYSQDFLEKVNQQVGNQTVYVGIIYGNEYISTNYWHAARGYGDMRMLNQQKVKAYEILMHTCNVDYSQMNTMHALRAQAFFVSCPFNKYVNSVNPNYTLEDIPQLQLDFMQTNNIHYLLLNHGGVLPMTMVPYVENIFVNQVGGQQFVVLNFEKKNQ
jgi:hypothetical protein